MPLKSVYGDDFLDGANYHSIKTQGNTLYKRARFKDALHSYETALTLNPRSRTIILEKSKCLAQMGDIDKALQEVDRLYGSGAKRPAQSDWRGGGNRNQKNQAREPETLSDLSYKCRYLLNKADALYSKGDFENALVLYHKGQRLRPKAPEFRLGIAKTEDALKLMFTEREREMEKQKRLEQKKSLMRDNSKKDEKRTKEQDQKSGNENNSKPENEDKPKPENDKHDEGKHQEGDNDKEKVTSVPENNETKPIDKQGKEKFKTDTSKENEKINAKLLTDEQKENIKATLAERKQRIREARLQFAIREREEARKIRAKYTGRPSGHLADDLEFLRMIYKNLKSNTVPNKRAQKLTQEAIGYIDTRNNFWNQQMPHHIREKSHFIQLPKGKTPPPTQAMFAFVIKETIRINNMMEKKQWHRSIETSKKLIEHIGKMERKIPNRESLIANIFSIMGNAHFELGDEKKALKFHLKDLEMSSEFDLEEAKSRALDNMGRVYVKLGEYDKAAAIWEQKMASDFETTPGERAWIYHEMGYCYMEIDFPEKAKECGDKSFEAAVEKEDLKWQLNAKLLIAQSLLRCGEAYQSKDEFEHASKIAIETKDEEAQIKINAALKEINDVLAEWDYMEDEEEDEGEFNEENNKKDSDNKHSPMESKSPNQSKRPEEILPDSQSQSPHSQSQVPHSQSEETKHRTASKPISKHTKDSDMLLVEEEHNKFDKNRNNVIDSDSNDAVKEDPPESDSPHVVFLGTVKDEAVVQKNDKATNKDIGQKKTKPPQPPGNSKQRNTFRNTKLEPVTKSKESSKKQTVKPKEPVYRGRVGPDINNTSQQNDTSPLRSRPRPENSNASVTTDKLSNKPKRENSNASMAAEKSYNKPKRENSNASMVIDKHTSKPKRELSNASIAINKPKREKSNASLVTGKPSRQNSNASLNPKLAREPSFAKAPKRESSNQSMRGRLSREGSNVSRLTNRSNKEPPQQQQTENVNSYIPRITKQEDTAAIYLQGGKPISRESSTVSKKPTGKAPRDTKQGKVNDEDFSRKPTQEEIKLNTKAIDIIAALNDPENTFAEADETNDGGDKDAKKKAFITEKSNMSQSTTAPTEKQ